MADYKILSPSYVRPFSGSANNTTFHNVSASGSTSTVKITPGQINSGKKYIAPTEGAYDHFRGTAKPLPYNGERMRRTSNNIWTVSEANFKKYGNFSPQVDDVKGFGSWKATGEDSQVREYVKLPKETSYSGVVEAFEPRKLNLHKNDTPVDLNVHDTWVNDVPNNKIGIYFHKVSNLRQLLSDYHGTRHAQDVSSDLNASGNPLEEIGYLSVGRMPENTIYGIYRTIDGKVVFSASKDANEYIVQDAEFFGVSPKEVRMYHIDEEEFHIGRKSFDKRGDSIKEEVATKDMQGGFYLRQIKRKAGDHQQQEIYKKLADMKQWDIESTPERYSNINDSGEEGLESIVANVENSSSEYTQTYSQNSQPAARSIGNILVNMPNIPAEKYSKSEKKNTNYGDEKSVYGESNNKGEYSRSNGKVVSIKDRRKTDKDESRSDSTKSEASDNPEASPQETDGSPADTAIAEAA